MFRRITPDHLNIGGVYLIQGGRWA
jgi:hypothetical protein